MTGNARREKWRIVQNTKNVMVVFRKLCGRGQG